MEEINKAYATFQERDRIASLGGGVEKIEKQHESGKMTARERIEMLLDKGTFVELDKLMVHRCTNYGMDKNKIPGDGIVSGYGKIDGRQVFVYAYDFTVYGGSLSASNAKKIVKVQQLALMMMQGIPFDFPLFAGFIFMLGITMVAAPGVPGGAIMAALGILQSMLGFDESAQALMIALYIAMDSFGTACNVTGDGAIALIIDKIMGKNRAERLC